MNYGRRNIKPGHEFDKYFEKPSQTAKNFGNNPVVYNVVNVIPKVVEDYNYQTIKIADYLYDSNLKKFANNIWNFLFNHIQYEFDKPGVEQFRTPARSWADRHEGIDCDCFSIFISCILTNKNIKHYIRITKYDNNTQWQHIYVIVPIPSKTFNPYDNSTYYTIDAVLHEFNREKEFTDQKTYIMDGNLGIVTEVLRGFDGVSSSSNIDIVNEVLQDTDLTGPSAVALDKIKRHLQSTRKWVEKNPTLVREQGGDPVSMIKMLDYALDNFDKGEEIRNKAFEILAKNEAAYNRNILNIDDDDLDGLIDDDDYQFSGIGDLGRTRAERKAARQTKRAARKETRQEKKTIKKTSRTERKTERKTEKAERKDERKEAQGFFRKVGVAVKQGGKAVFVKYNPAIIASRQGFLQAVKLNLFRLASRLAPAYRSEADAAAKGINYRAAKKMNDKVLQIFNDKLQGSSAELKEAVLIGALKQGQDLQGIVYTFSGLGSAAVLSSILTAVPVLVSVVNAIYEVEDEYGIEGLGSIEDDVYEAEIVLNDYDDMIEDYMNGLGAAKKIDATAMIAFLKRILGNIKQKRQDKKGMTKEERKFYNEVDRDIRKKEKEKRKSSTKTPIKTFFNKFKSNNDEQEPLEDDNNEETIEKTKMVIDPDAANEGWFARNKKKILFAGLGLGVLTTGAILLNKYGKKSKPQSKSSLKGVSGKPKKVIKASL